MIVVATGYRPRWTCIPQWYVTFSLTASMPAINGGDNAAVIATMLAVPLCLGDRRTWQWTRPSGPLSARWRGRAFAAQLVIRFQVALIYVTAAGSKLVDPAWRDGSALYFVLHDPQFGLPASALRTVAPLLDSRWLVALVTWSVIAAQLAIAVLVLGRRRRRLVAAFLVTGLHLAIIVLMGLPSFGLAMIAFALLALGPGAARRPRRSRSTARLTGQLRGLRHRLGRLHQHRIREVRQGTPPAGGVPCGRISRRNACGAG
ncbi:HTTM domain-containing protein [Kutzneria sp. NPDC052558]|uniref:HTTM domain-containing protein n=1 Tax=Kutzneria sp. NPDC052558 TaxID=3364121 RepID=UPI0037C7B85D